MDHKDVIIQDLRAENKKLTEELKAYRQLEKKMHEEFQGHINTEMIVNSFIAFYEMQEVNEELAECLLLTNENVKKYKEYKQLEEQGLLLELPCEFGTDVFVVPTKENSFNQIACMKFLGIQWDTLGAVMNLFSDNRFNKNVPKMYQPSISNFGKTVFLTEQEAQSALENMKAGEVNG